MLALVRGQTAEAARLMDVNVIAIDRVEQGQIWSFVPGSRSRGFIRSLFLYLHHSFGLLH
jgi:hypothetical protein